MHIHRWVGAVMDPVVPSTDPEEPITVTPDQIIAHRRRRLLELADELGNVSAACRQLGVSRTRFYEWKRLAEAYGMDAAVYPARSAAGSTTCDVAVSFSVRSIVLVRGRSTRKPRPRTTRTVARRMDRSRPSERFST